MRYLKYSSLKNIIYCFSLTALGLNLSMANTITSANVTGDAISGSTYYRVDPSSISNPLELEQITNPNESELIALLGGNASLAGGNVELYAASDGASMGAFQNAERVSLNLGYTDGSGVTLSSLNGQDWFNSATTGYDTTYGADNLANRWFNEFTTVINTAAPIFTAANTESFFDSFLSSGGFQQQSDPNISYVDKSGNTVTVGLGGFIDIKPRVISLISAVTGTSVADLNALIPGSIQSSEVVLINGVPNYGFSAVPSGVVLDDGFSSYTATYEVTTQVVPEPSSVMLLVLGASTLILRRNR